MTLKEESHNNFSLMYFMIEKDEQEIVKNIVKEKVIYIESQYIDTPWALKNYTNHLSFLHFEPLKNLGLHHWPNRLSHLPFHLLVNLHGQPSRKPSRTTGNEYLFFILNLLYDSNRIKLVEQYIVLDYEQKYIVLLVFFI